MVARPRFSWRRRRDINILSRADQSAALRLCAAHPLDSILVAVQARYLPETAWARGPHLVGIGQRGDDDFEALGWVGSNIVPVGTTDHHREALAEHIGPRRLAGTSMVGPQNQVMDLWERLNPRWGAANEIRETQPLLVIDQPSGAKPDPLVRRARDGETSLVLPASVAMFIEEVGFDPTRNSRGYANRVGELIRAGHTWIRTDTGPDGKKRVVFKADVGALAMGVAQIQGVWVHPDLRGRGIATSAMATVFDDILQTVAPTASLYVNDFNHAALALYRKLGMRQESTWSTIMV